MYRVLFRFFGAHGVGRGHVTGASAIPSVSPGPATTGAGRGLDPGGAAAASGAASGPACCVQRKNRSFPAPTSSVGHQRLKSRASYDVAATPSARLLPADAHDTWRPTANGARVTCGQDRRHRGALHPVQPNGTSSSICQGASLAACYRPQTGQLALKQAGSSWKRPQLHPGCC
jgi:hypothetical protein